MTTFLHRFGLVLGLFVLFSNGDAWASTFTSFTPTSGPIGTKVTVVGTGFATNLVVKFNNMPATLFNLSANNKSFEVNVPSGATTGDLVVDGLTASNGPKVFTVTLPADVTTSITVSTDPVSAGQGLVFNVVFGNNGPSTAAGVTRQVQLPANLGVANVTVATPTGTGTYNNSSGLVTFAPTPTTLASGGNLNATVTIGAVPGSLVSVAATATITTTTDQGTTTADNTATKSVAVTPVADVTTTLAGPTTLTVGQPSGDFSVTYVNNGPSAASGVTRIITLPSGVTSVVAASGTVSGNIISYTPTSGSMTSGQSDTFMFSFTAPTTTGSGLLMTSNIGTTTNQGSSGAADAATLSLTVAGGLIGYVFEDPNYGGGSGRPRSVGGTSGRPGATVQLYDASGNYVSSAITNGAGQYTFPVTTSSYTVRVVNSTITSSRPSAVASLLPVQIYNGTTDRVGGEDPSKVDAGSATTTLAALTTATTTAQSVATVATSGNGTTTGPDFGFNFSTIVNTKDNGQGSLRQFLLNSNQLTNVGLDQVASSNGGPDPVAGIETSLFMISDGLAHAGLRNGLPNQLTGTGGAARAVIILTSTVTITDANTGLDATSQTLNVGNTNLGTIGASELVGVDGLSLTALNRPEVEIVGAGLTTVVSVTGGNATVRQVALRGGSGQTLNFATGATGFLIDETLVGTSAISYVWSGDNTVSGSIGINVPGAGVVGTVQGSIVAFTGNSGINLNNGTSTVGTFTIKDSEFNQNGYTSAGGDGISLGDGVGSGPVLIEGNLFTRTNSSAVQFEIGQTAASITRNNTIISAGKGGAGTNTSQLEGSAICYLQRNGNRRGAQSDLLTKNVIVDTQASAIVVGYGQRNVTISQNSIFNSGSIAIDLNTQANAYVGGPNPGSVTYGSGDGVTLNDGNDPATADPVLPNRGVDFPVLTSLDIIGSNLVVEGFSRPGARIEFFIPALDPTRFGEGRTYLTTRTDNLPADDALTDVGSYGPGLVNNLAQGQDAVANRFRFTLPFTSLTTEQQNDIRNLGLTATATLDGSTSEFSGNVPFAADVTATIAAQASPVGAGTEAKFNVSFSNTGSSAANGVKATVQLPANLVGVAVTGGSYASGSGLITYPAITSLARNEVVNSVISYIQPMSGASVTAMAAVMTTTSQNGLTANDSQWATIQNNPQNFDLLTTVAGPASMGAGQPGTYAVTTQNVGLGTAPDAVQVVSLPTTAALTHVFVSNGGSYSYSSGMSTFTFLVPASLAPGQIINNTFSFVAPASGPLSFTARVTPNTLVAGDQVTTNNQVTISTIVTTAPTTVANVYTTISSNAVNDSAAPGAAVTYTVTQGNNGPSAATDVMTSVALSPRMTPAGFTVAGVSGIQPGGLGTAIGFALPGGTATYNPTTGVLTMPTVATQASGASALYTVVAPAPGSAQITPTSSVAATTADPVPADNVASTQITLNNALTADLSTTIVGPASAAAAQPLQYFLTTTNNGPGQAQNVVQSVAIPAGLPIVGANAVRINGNVPTSISGTMASYGTGATAATYDAAAGLVNIPIAIGVTGPGTSVVNSVAYNVPVNDGNLVNVAAVRATSLDNAAANNTAQVVSTVQPQADVQVLIAGPTSSTVGAPVTFVVTTTNLGPSIVPTQTISVQLPSTLTSGSGVVEVRNNAGNIQPGVVYNNTNGTVTLPAITNQSNGTGAAVRFTISFLTPAGSVFSPTARTSVPGTLDPILGNNEASVSVSVSPATPIRPDLSTSFAAGTSTSATAGQPVTLVVQTANAAGMPTATNVVQDVMLIGGLTTTGLTVGGTVGAFNATTGLLEFAVTNGTATYSPSTGLLSIPINSLIAGASTTTSIVLPAPGSSLLAVTAAVHGAQSDAVTTNNRATTILPVAPTVGVQTTVAGPISAPLGSMVTYSIVTTNNGPSDAANVVQTATLPAGATNVVVSGGGTQSGDVVTFPMIATLVPGTTGLITNSISFTVPNTTPSITVTGNVTAIGDNTPGGNNTSNQVTATQPNRPPVASDVVNTIQSPLGNTAVMKVAMSTLLATDVDGNPTVVTYTLTSFPSPATVGTLYVNGVAVTAPRTLTTVEVSQLSFLPKAGFVGNMFFTYTVTDNGNGNAAQALTSNVARYTLQVGQDVNSVYARPTTTKGGNSNKYVAGDVLAYGIDPNTAQYNSVGLIYDVATGAAPTTGIGLVNNGIRVAKISVADSTALAAVGIRFTRATALFTVFNPALLPRAGVTLSPITVTSLDRNGGVNINAVVLVTGASPLPVELTEFTAQAVKNIDAQLAWRTASEKNNDHFDVERSLNGTDFRKVGQVQGQGSKTTPTAYALTDVGIGTQASGQVYYRLLQVDSDGTATFSPVRTVTFVTAAIATISLYPVPASASTTLALTALPANQYYAVRITDLSGRQVGGYTLAGGQAHRLALAGIASGAYLITLTGRDAQGQALTIIKRLIKE